MSGFDQNKNLASKISPSNLFESLMLSNATMTSTSIEQAQNFLNQVLYNNSYHSMMQGPTFFTPSYFANHNYPVSSMPVNFSHQYKQNHSFSMQSNKSLDRKESGNKNRERLKYLDDLLSRSIEASNLELEKTLIYEHRLFPLLKFMFEKCELATLNPDLLVSSEKIINGSGSMCFDTELKKFLKENEQRLVDQSLDNVIKYSSNDHLKQVYLSVDELIMNTILVLRINLIEIEKVSELCSDFVEQYVEALKVKLNSDNIFNIDEEDEQSTELDEQEKSNSNAKAKRLKKNPPKKLSKLSGEFCTTSTPIKRENSPYEISPNVSLSKIKFNMLSTDKSDNSNQSETSNNLSIDFQEEANHLCDEDNQYLNDSANIEEDIDDFDDNVSVKSHVSTYAEKSSSSSSSCVNKSYSSNNDDSLSSKNKRGILPKSATNVMKKWLFQHIVHPYPTEEEKRQIAVKTNLTLIQVNNWFINARRRILQPMLEASNPDLTKKKKSPQVSSIKPYQNSRYWPPSLSHFGQKSSRQESDRYCQNAIEEGPVAKKTKTGNESFQRETNQSSNQASISDIRQKSSDHFYQQMYAQVNPMSSLSPNQCQLVSSNPVYNLKNNAQSSKSSPQKPNGFRIENLIGNDETKKNNENKLIEFMQQQFYHQMQSYNMTTPTSSFNCVLPGSSFFPHQKP